jgi:hypothetical protein
VSATNHPPLNMRWPSASLGTTNRPNLDWDWTPDDLADIDRLAPALPGTPHCDHTRLAIPSNAQSRIHGFARRTDKREAPIRERIFRGGCCAFRRARPLIAKCAKFGLYFTNEC